MKTLLTFLTLICLTITWAGNPAFADDERFLLVQIPSGAEVSSFLEQADVHIDHAIRKAGYTEVWLSYSEFESIKKAGVPYIVIESDWHAYYDRLPEMSAREIRKTIEKTSEELNITHSIYGSMGGFLKFSEVVAKLDSMRLQYPGLVSAKFSIGNSVESRSVWTVRMTKNPDAPTGRPEMWYHSLIHAREPESMQHMIFYMYWLLENYGIDPVATYILENRELYFTPVLNPDGYVYNETTNPNGGGLWRKNRRNNGTSYGVDLNRNYGLYQYWNSSNGGSSTSPSSDTYRGTSPFSEPETIGAMNFVNSRNFNAIFGSHTYGNYLIKPWAWQDPVPTPDDYKFNVYLADMSANNGYTTGTPYQTVGYKTRGSSDDWYYNDSVHSSHNIIAITPETGTTGFWPSQSEIVPLAESMLFSNKYMALIAGPFVSPVSTVFSKKNYSSGEAGTFAVTFRNKGLLNASNVNVSFAPASYYLNIPVSNFGYQSLSSFQTDSSLFGFIVSPAVPVNSALPALLSIRQNSATVVTEKRYVTVGSGNLTLADSAENGFTKWTTNQGWATTTSQFHSPSRSFTDSPSGSYANNANNSMTLSASLNVTAAPVVYLSFWHRYATEAGYDFCYVEVSKDNGASWTTVKSYNGTATVWQNESIDVTDAAGGSSQLKIRFRLFSDGGVAADGWYVDDIRLTNYSLLENAVNTALTINFAPQAFVQANSQLNMNDTVRVALRSVVPPYGEIEWTHSVLDSVNRSAVAVFRNTPTGSYYITVNHRNSVEIWSRSGGEPFTFGGSMSYNFTDAASKAFGGNEVQVSGLFCAYSGDVNQDGSVDATDASIVDNDALASVGGYVPSDVNGDGFVDGTDALYVDNNAMNFVQKITP